MIDFIKALIKNINPLEFQQHPKLNFCIPVNPITGELRARTNNKKAQGYLNAYYKSLEFRIYESGSVYVLGSLHKFWNNGKHNFNDFNFNAVNTVLNEIKDTFNIKPQQLLLRQLEIGVNFIPPYPTEKILTYCFLHVTNPFEWKYNSDEGKFIQSEHSQYIIKIYDKVRHYRSKKIEVPHPEIMRFEIKYKKLEKIKRFGIFTIKDLINYGLENFVSILVEEWQKILFYDFSINHKSKSLLNYKNPIYWYEIKNRHSAYYKNKKKLTKFILNHSDNIPNQIKTCIQEKGIQLTKRGTQIDQKRATNNRYIKKDRGTQIDTLYIQSNCTPYILNKECIYHITDKNTTL